MNIHVILNGAQLRYESRRPLKERFFAALRMTKNSLLEYSCIVVAVKQALIRIVGAVSEPPPRRVQP